MLFRSNKLFSMYEYTTGGKTGYTDAAHRTLVTTASRDNKNLVVVTLNDGNDFNDHKSLYETYFDKYMSILAIDKNNFRIDEDYYEDVEFYVKNDYYALVTKEEKDDFDIKEEDSLLDISDDNTPSVAKVTMGDAEEYYSDLGLEYNIDYKDVSHEKATGRRTDLKSFEEEETKNDDASIEDNLFDLIDSMYDEKKGE